MKTESYSTYEAKAKFSEILRKVRRNQRVVITYRGEPVAEIGPVSTSEDTLEERLARMADEGIVTPGNADALSAIGPIDRRDGASVEGSRS